MIDLAGGAARWRITDLEFGGYARLSPDGASVASFSNKTGFCLHRAADGKRLWCRARTGLHHWPARFLTRQRKAGRDGGGRRAGRELRLGRRDRNAAASAGATSDGAGAGRRARRRLGGAGGPARSRGPALLAPGARARLFSKGLLHLLALGPGDRLLAAADDRGALHLVQMASGPEVNRIEFSEDQVRSAAWSPDFESACSTRDRAGRPRGSSVPLPRPAHRQQRCESPVTFGGQAHLAQPDVSHSASVMGGPA